VFLEIVFRLEAKIIKLKAGCGVFLCQRAKAFPANITVLLVSPLEAIFYRAPVWLCDPRWVLWRLPLCARAAT
jgi:hypothetical protein